MVVFDQSDRTRVRANSKRARGRLFSPTSRYTLFVVIHCAYPPLHKHNNNIVILLFHHSISTVTMTSSTTRAYEIRPVSGKGLGIFATRGVTKGTTVIREPFLLSVTNPHTPETVATAVANLSPAERAAFLVLHMPANKPGDGNVLDANTPKGMREIFLFNCFGRDHGHTSAVYLQTSRMNHSCQPNCAAVANGDDNVVRALKDIAAGDELTIDYGQLGDWLLFERREQLMDYWEFFCECEKCVVDEAAWLAGEDV